MNLGKSREYYSAYYEGSLERGLREGFERALREDAQVQAEYRAFEMTMRQLESLKANAIEPPEDLHDRIMARMDRHIWEKNQARKPGIFAWWKTALLVGAAGTAIVLAALQPGRSAGPANTSGFTPMGSSEKLEVHAMKSGVVIDYSPVRDRLIQIRDADGTVLESVHLKNQAMSHKALANEATSAKLLCIDVKVGDKESKSTWIALPGSERDGRSVGKGTLKDMALDIADGCGLPVVLEVSDADVNISWKLDTADGHSTASKATTKHVELRGDGDNAAVLWISDN